MRCQTCLSILQRVQPTFAHRAMDKAHALIDEHYTQTNSNRTSYEIVPPDSEENKRIAEFNKARRSELYE